MTSTLTEIASPSSRTKPVDADGAAPVRLAPLKSWAAALLIAATFFAAVAPTLTWVQFHDPIENLNVATALEMRRGGPWLVPNLQGVPRLAKPPLTAWVTAASIRPSTIARLSTPDPAARAAAYDQLAWEVRWPALASMCVMLVVVYGLGRALGDDLLGALLACVCGTTWFFLRHCRLATTDGQLALWVAAANLFLALAVFRGRRWLGCLGTGAALGLVLMSKGPVGLAQTVLPFGLFLLLAWRKARREYRGMPFRPNIRAWIIPALLGGLLTIVIGGWWYAWVAAHNADMASFWFSEVSRRDADDVPPGAWFQHAVSLYLFIPWLLWLAGGAILAWRDVRPAPSDPLDADTRDDVEAPGDRTSTGLSPALLGLLLLIVPLVLMSFAKDRFQRYLAPLAPAGALLAAYALWLHWHDRPAGERSAGLRRAGVVGHWAILTAIAIGGPLAIATGRMKSFLTADGQPWFRPGTAALWAAAGLVTVAGGIWLHRRWRGGLVLATVLLMFVVQAIYAHGQGRSESGRSALRAVSDAIWARYPDAAVYVPRTAGRNLISVGGNDLSIHLNRPVTYAPSVADVPQGPAAQIWINVRTKRAPRRKRRPGGRC